MTGRGGKGGSGGRGFASMDGEVQRRIAREGGRAAHAKGTAHEFTPEEARLAGRKGGEVVSQNREHMAAIGRKGGESSHGGGRSRVPNRGDGAQDPDQDQDQEMRG